METLKEKIVQVLKNDCSFSHPVSTYMNHIVIKLSTEAGDFYKVSKNIENEIKVCINDRYPQREDNLSFCVKMDGQEHVFKIWKTVNPSNTFVQSE